MSFIANVLLWYDVKSHDKVHKLKVYLCNNGYIQGESRRIPVHSVSYLYDLNNNYDNDAIKYGPNKGKENNSNKSQRLCEL